jgi:hypothetical protein
MMELPGMMGVTPRAAASQKFLLQFLCDYANAVIDGETGEFMEYRHLLKNPKHRERWQKAFSREIRQLATVTETIKFVLMSEIQKEQTEGSDLSQITGCAACAQY